MNIGILTSGGDAPGMNAAIRAIVRRALADGHAVWGIERGFDGLVNGYLRSMDISSVADILMKGGTILRTSRFPAFKDIAHRALALQQLKTWAIDGLIIMGGNGTLAGALQLTNDGVPVVGIPISIDNDIAGTDYSIGFDTALNNIIGSMDKIRDTASAHDRIFVIEVMGNQNGTLAVAAGLAAGAEAIIVPERVPDYDFIAQRLKETKSRGKRHSFIVVAEGAGSAIQVSSEVAERTGYEARWVVLGHTQRGGPPTAYDRIMASLYADRALQALSDGDYGTMVGITGNDVMIQSLSAVVGKTKQPPWKWLDLAAMLGR